MSLVYETSCHTCQTRDEEMVRGRWTGDEKGLKEELMKVKRYIYIGETARSSYERGWEHINDIDQLKPSSHMLRHLIDQHSNEEWEGVNFHMRVLKYTRSSFDRQILESVLIQNNRNHHILNSRSEYNRCALPRLSAKM